MADEEKLRMKKNKDKKKQMRKREKIAWRLCLSYQQCNKSMKIDKSKRELEKIISIYCIEVVVSCSFYSIYMI